MNSLFKSLCLVLALMSTTGLVVAKESTTTQINKAEFSDKTVNLNKADANTLRYYLKGIGEVKADAIIQYRKKNGNFSSVDDLLKVPGIGEATLKGLKKNVSTSRGETTAPKLPAARKTSKSSASSSAKTSAKSSTLLGKSGDKADETKAVKEDSSKSKVKKSAKKPDVKKEGQATVSKTKAAAKKSLSSKAAKCDSAKDKSCKAKVSKKVSKAKKTAKSKSATKKSKDKAKKPKSKTKDKTTTKK